MALTRPRTLIMKDLKNLVNNFSNAPVKHFKEDEVVIDEFAKNIINQVFTQLSIIFPAWKHNWKSDDPSNPDKILNLAKMEWTKAFNENGINTLDQVKFGFAKARKSESDFLPSCGKFISWCSPSPEDMGYPSEHTALRDCLSHQRNKKMFKPENLRTRPFIVELCKHVDWWMINSVNNQSERVRADKHFKDEYMALINSNYQEPEVTPYERLETKEIIVDRMSPEQKEDARQRGLESMKRMKQQLAKAKLKNIGE